MSVFPRTHEVRSLHFHFCSRRSELWCWLIVETNCFSPACQQIKVMGSQWLAEAIGRITSSSYCFLGGSECSVIMPSTPLIIFLLKLHFLSYPCKYEEQSHCYCLSYFLFLLGAEPERLKTMYSEVLEVITFPRQSLFLPSL